MVRVQGRSSYLIRCTNYKIVSLDSDRLLLFSRPASPRNRCSSDLLQIDMQSSGFPTRSDTNRAVQPQKMTRGLKFRIYVEEGLHYPCNENKGADQLRGHREADLRLCFRICKKPVFSRCGSYHYTVNAHRLVISGSF